MDRAKKKNMITTTADAVVRAFAAAGEAIAKLRNNIPDRELIDSVDRGGAVRGDGLVVIDALLRKLADSGRIYAHNKDVILTSADNQSFRTLAIDGRAEPKAAAMLSNLVMCVNYRTDPSTNETEQWQFKLPDCLCDQLFANDLCLSRLPVVVTYAKHSVFDDDFVLHHPGYSKDKGILVQGLRLSPDMSTLPAVPTGCRPLTVHAAIERLPPHIRTLLKDFDWASPVDLTNAVGVMLMGLLMNAFIEDGHPMLLIRGNQPEIGKSLLAKVIAMVFDGIQVSPVKKAVDDEFDKLLCAFLAKGRRAVFFDNVRGKMDSERIEAHVTSPMITLRILGTNAFGEWPNDVLFLMTSNDLRASADLVSRNLTIDLYTEGDPRKRNAERKKSEPLQYAAAYRVEILNELAAYVLRWLDKGRPDGDPNTRFEKVSRLIGGILSANGLPGFASNSESVAIEMDEGLQRMLELAERMVSGSHPDKAISLGASADDAGKLAAGWVELFTQLHLIDPKPEETATSKAIKVAKVFSAYIDRPIFVDNGPRRCRVTFRKREGRAGGKVFYYAEVEAVDGNGDSQAKEAQEGPNGASGPTINATPLLPESSRLSLETTTPRRVPPAGWLKAAIAINKPTTPGIGRDAPGCEIPGPNELRVEGTDPPSTSSST